MVSIVSSLDVARPSLHFHTTIWATQTHTNTHTPIPGMTSDRNSCSNNVLAADFHFLLSVYISVCSYLSFSECYVKTDQHRSHLALIVYQFFPSVICQNLTSGKRFKWMEKFLHVANMCVCVLFFRNALLLLEQKEITYFM